MQKRLSVCLIALLILAGSLCVEAAYLVHENGTLPILSYKAIVKINDQVAITSLEMVFHNPNEHPVQANLKFPISETAAIQKFALTDGEGKVFTGSAAEDNEPVDTFGAVMPPEPEDSGLFETSMGNVAAGSRVTVMIEYSELLPYWFGKTVYTLPLAIKDKQKTALETVSIKISIIDQKEIASVESTGQNVSIDKNGKGTWNALFEKRGYLPADDFKLTYELKAGIPTTNFLTTKPEIDQDGYFMLTLSPSEIISDKDIAMHDLVFVIDTSGSMSYRKDEIKRLFSFFIKQLNASDRFGIVSFSSLANTFMPELVPASEANRQTASDFINYLNVNNNTDIHTALLAAVKLFDNAEGRTRTMVLLTDGRTGVGIQDTNTIVRDFTASNTNGARIFALGVGMGVNVELLNRLAAENRGEAVYFEHSEDYEQRLMHFCESIKTPLLVDLELNWGGAEVSEVFPQNLPNIYHGSRFLIRGRYSKAASTEITLTGTLNNVKHSFPINATFVEKSEDNLFVRKLWAKVSASSIAQTQRREIQLRNKKPTTARTIVRRSETRPLSFWGIYGFLPIAIAKPDYARTRHPGGHWGCHANQRVLHGAIEMYYMDNNIMIAELDQEAMDNLLKGQYLKSPIIPVNKDCCFSTTDSLLRDGKLVCSVHGNPEIVLEDISDQQTSAMFREGAYLDVIDGKQLVINKTEVVHEEDSWFKKTWNSWLSYVVNFMINVPLFLAGLALSLYLMYIVVRLPFKAIVGLFESFNGKQS